MANNQNLPEERGTSKGSKQWFQPHRFTASEQRHQLIPMWLFTEITREVVRAIECSCYGYKQARTNSRDGSLSDCFDLSQHAHQLFVFGSTLHPDHA